MAGYLVYLHVGKLERRLGALDVVRQHLGGLGTTKGPREARVRGGRGEGVREALGASRLMALSGRRKTLEIKVLTGGTKKSTRAF